MRWIRGPLWDGVWILSGLPIGLALATERLPMDAVLAGFLALNSAHLLAPIALAWSRRGFRRVMTERKLRYVALPIAIVLLGAVLGLTIGRTFLVNPITMSARVEGFADYARPFVMLFPIYFIWNAYHFGMQNYGFLRLYWPSAERAAVAQWAMFATLFGLIIIPLVFHQPQIGLFFFGLVIVNHQLAAIGLSSHVWAQHHRRSPLWFAGALIAVGTLAAWLILRSLEQATMLIVGLRITLGFVHFLYDRWIWKFSNPQVRETIGKDLFACRQSQARRSLFSTRQEPIFYWGSLSRNLTIRQLPFLFRKIKAS